MTDATQGPGTADKDTAPNIPALDALIAAVEAGNVGAGLNTAAVFGDNQTAMDAVDAFHGSLDAALALHSALLPGWWWDVTVDYAISTDPTGRREFVAGADNPARAWLLATIKACRAQVAG
jgi:hypothetical protein